MSPNVPVDLKEEKVLHELYEAEKGINGAGYAELLESEPALRQAVYSAKEALEINLKRQAEFTERRDNARAAVREFYGTMTISASSELLDVHDAVKAMAESSPQQNVPDGKPDPDEAPRVNGMLTRSQEQDEVLYGGAAGGGMTDAVRKVIGSSSEVTDEALAEARAKDDREARSHAPQSSFLRPAPG
jgi:hypothetical protein